MLRVPLACCAEIVRVVAPPAPAMTPAPRSALNHWSVTVWAVWNRTSLVIVTVAVADAPPSTSCVTALPFESVSVKLHAGASTVFVTLASAPLPIPFTARTSKVYSVPDVRPVTVWLVVLAPLPVMLSQVVAAGTDVPAA